MDLTAQDHRNIYIFLQRTPITGDQAVGMAVLLQKLEAIVQEQAKPVEPSRDGAKEEAPAEPMVD